MMHGSASVSEDVGIGGELDDLAVTDASGLGDGPAIEPQQQLLTNAAQYQVTCITWISAVLTRYLKTYRTGMVNEIYARITSRAFSLDHIFKIESHSVNP